MTALQSTAASAYSKTQILGQLHARQEKLNDNVEQKALNYVEEFPALSSSPRQGNGPMNAVKASASSSKRAYQPTPLELVRSPQSKRPSSFSVSAVTVATQVGVSTSVFLTSHDISLNNDHAVNDNNHMDDNDHAHTVNYHMDLSTDVCIKLSLSCSR